MNQTLMRAPLKDRTQRFWRASQCLLAAGGEPERRRDALRELATLSRFDNSRRLRVAASRTVAQRQLGAALRLLDRDAAAVTDLPFPGRTNRTMESAR